MTKETKARMIAIYELELERIDLLIELNFENENAVKSLSQQYRKLAKELEKIRDSKTIN